MIDYKLSEIKKICKNNVMEKCIYCPIYDMCKNEFTNAPKEWNFETSNYNEFRSDNTMING